MAETVHAQKKILVIDDDDAMADSVRDALEQRGFVTRHASSSLEAFELVGQEKIDLIILDVMLSYRSEGFQIAFDLNADEKTRDIPIVMLTGVRRHTRFRFTPDAEGLTLPVTRFLEKPVRNDVLCNEVEGILRSSHA